MDFNFDTGFGDVDPYTSFGAGGYVTVPTDVSMGDAPMQSWTPTGNGSGEFISASTQQSILGGLQSVLNYAMMRDQQKMTAVGGPVQVGAARAQVTARQENDKRLFTYALIGLGVYLVTRK